MDVDISAAMRQVFDKLITRSERMQQAEETGDGSFDVADLESDLDTLYQDDGWRKNFPQSAWETLEGQTFSAYQDASDFLKQHGISGRITSVTRSGGPKTFVVERRVQKASDLFDTGEEQPRLPGAEDVREQDIKTPEFEAPFALTSEVSKAKKGKQDTLFQEDGTPRPLTAKERRRAKQITLDELGAVARRRKLTLEAVRAVAEQGGYPVVDDGPRPVQTEGGRVIPSTGRIPDDRLHEFPSIQKMPKAIRPDIEAMLQRYQGFENQRRGVQTWARTRELAKDVWLPLETLKPGKAINAEEADAYGNAIATALTMRQELLAKGKDHLTDWEKLQVVHLTNVATSFTASYRGAKAEWGRMGGILRAQRRVLDLGESKFLDMALQAPGFQGDLAKIAKEALDAAGDPLKQLQLLRQRSAATWFDYVQAMYYANLLSGIKTHERNIIGNAFNALANIAMPLGAVPADLYRVARHGGERSMYASELPHAIAGTFVGIGRGVTNAAFTMRHGFRPSVVEAARQGRFDVPRVELPGGLANPFNVPGRALEAADEFFWAIAYHQELYAGAFAQARTEGLEKADAIADRMAHLIASTDLSTDDGKAAADLFDRANEYADHATFNEKPGYVVRTLLKLKSPKAPIPVRAVATIIVPFMKIAGAIMRQGFEWSPAGLVMKGGRSADARVQAQARGRAALGSLALIPMVWLAATGRLTGAPPDDEGEREEFYALGKLGNAVKIGKHWVRYVLFQPYSVMLAAVASAWQAWEHSEQDEAAAQDAFMAGLAGAGKSLLDQSFLSGLESLQRALDEPKRAGRWLSAFVTGLVPLSGLARNAAQAVDPVIRKPAGVKESVQAIVPGASANVPARRDRFGEPVTRPGGAVRRGFVVPEVSAASSDALVLALAKVQYRPTASDPTLTVRGERLTLTREQEDVLSEALGQEKRAAIEMQLTRTGFTSLPDERQVDAFQSAPARATADVRQRAIREWRRRPAARQKDPFTLEQLLSVRVLEQRRRDQVAVFGEAARAGR